MLVRADYRVGSLCVMKWHCLLAKPGCVMLKELERSVSEYCVVNTTGHFSDSEVILFLSLLFCSTQLFTCNSFPPPSHRRPHK